MRHSGEPYSVSWLALSLRSEIFVTPSSSAFFLSSPTSLEEVKGVGGKASMPSLARPDLTCS